MRLQLGDLLEAEEEWGDAAKALTGIPMDSGHRYSAEALHVGATNLDNRPIPDAFKLELYVRIVRLYLEDDDAVSAETYFNRATLLIRGNEDKALNRKPALGPPFAKV